MGRWRLIGSGLFHVLVLRLSLFLLCSLTSGASAQATAGGAVSQSQMQVLEGMMRRLEGQDSKGLPRVMRFNDFSYIEGLECPERLVLMWNVTMRLLQDMHDIYNEVLESHQMYSNVLTLAPSDNSWIWLVINAQDQIAERIHEYLTRLSCVALDHHLCLMTDVRGKLLEFVVDWKARYSELLTLRWGGLAYSAFTDKPKSSPEDTAVSMYNGNMWVEKVHDWFQTFAFTLSGTLQKELPSHKFEQVGGAATRLHHQDQHGAFIPYEYLRRKAFGQWALDKGLLRALIRYVWQPPLEGSPLTLGDFGAGGGQYSAWLNETGLIQAFAFDGTPMAAQITNGTVQEISLVDPFKLWRTFDWILCLEVGEHIPPQFASTLLENVKQHAVKGIVMSWSDDWEGLGHVNCLSKAEFISRVERETGFALDKGATELVAARCEIDYIGRTVAVFRAPS